MRHACQNTHQNPKKITLEGKNRAVTSENQSNNKWGHSNNKTLTTVSNKIGRTTVRKINHGGGPCMSLCFDLYYIKKRGHVQRPSSSHNTKGEAMSNVSMSSSHKLLFDPTPLSWPFNIVFWTDLNIFFEVENDLKYTETVSRGGFFLFTTMEINLQVDELSSSFPPGPLS